ncbi:YppG family protein [Pseudalkalibacillus sp. A8]|uniref:YppG family protein n=1 Tax=Pseudalkalibacillus sp. A8 TaxID=3382641 RepID=UPI0038B625A3
MSERNTNYKEEGYNPFDYMFGEPADYNEEQHDQLQKYPQKTGTSNILIDYFKTQDGTFDIEKMITTFGQVKNSIDTIRPKVDTIFSLFKGSSN